MNLASKGGMALIEVGILSVLFEVLFLLTLHWLWVSLLLFCPGCFAWMECGFCYSLGFMTMMMIGVMVDIVLLVSCSLLLSWEFDLVLVGSAWLGHCLIIHES